MLLHTFRFQPNTSTSCPFPATCTAHSHTYNPNYEARIPRCDAFASTTAPSSQHSKCVVLFTIAARIWESSRGLSVRRPLSGRGFGNVSAEACIGIPSKCTISAKMERNQPTISAAIQICGQKDYAQGKFHRIYINQNVTLHVI